MKDRVREALFNLVGPSIREKHALDLFGGTGALGLEALSRGASGATFIEQHYPTAAILRRNAATLGVDSQIEIVTANVFAWFEQAPQLSDRPWAVFCSPPYDFYVERTEDLLTLLSGLMERSRPASLFAVEADRRFNFELLPEPDRWNVRTYPPAVVGVYRKEEEKEPRMKAEPRMNADGRR